MTKILHLNVKKEWFDKIKSGEKKCEYREFKDYWITRLLNDKGLPKKFDLIIFKNGYKKDSEKLIFKHKITEVMIGTYTDLKLDEHVFAIYLGKRVE